jgi:AcrR family transcriptional regulator
MSLREPQQERSRATRQALLDAAIESLAEVGWAGTTVVAVAARAGVSRGAAQHHFTTRDDLVRAAVEKVSDDITAGLRANVAEVSGRSDRARATVAMLAEMWIGVFGRAATHLWVAASTDPALHELVLPLERRLSREVYATTFDLLGLDPSDADAAASVRLTLDLVRGVGLAALLRPESRHRADDLERWAAVVGAP